MSSSVIELSKYNDVNSGNTVNSNWTNNLPKAIKLEEGDTVEVKNVFIDITSGSSSNIQIESDITCTISFWYYMQNHIHSSVFSASWYATFLPCMALNGSNELISGEHVFIVPAGTYSPNGLAELMSREMSSVQRPIETVPLTSISNAFLRGSDATGATTKFCSLDMTTGVIDANEYFYPPSAMWYGASQVGLTFNSEQNNTFQFEYLHTPFYDLNGDESVGMFSVVNAGPPVHTKLVGVDRHSGVLLTGLSPSSLWEDILGFDVSAMTVSNTGLTINFPAGKSFNDLTTTGLFTLDTVLNNSAGSLECPDKEYWKKVTGTAPIKAVNAYDPLVGGAYFLIDCNLNYSQDYNYDNGIMPNISAIVSRQYSNNDYVTGFGDCSITYTHRGSPVLLSDARLRILDPISKNEVSSLGKNSSVFLEVFKKQR